jgi:hypothetical protein
MYTSTELAFDHFSHNIGTGQSGARRWRVHHGGAHWRRGGGAAWLAGRGRSRTSHGRRGTSSTRRGSTAKRSRGGVVQLHSGGGGLTVMGWREGPAQLAVCPPLPSPPPALAHRWREPSSSPTLFPPPSHAPDLEGWPWSSTDFGGDGRGSGRVERTQTAQSQRRMKGGGAQSFFPHRSRTGRGARGQYSAIQRGHVPIWGKVSASGRNALRYLCLFPFLIPLDTQTVALEVANSNSQLLASITTSKHNLIVLCES